MPNKLERVLEARRVQRRIILEIQCERHFQDKKWGVDRKLPIGDWMLILHEETGEACQSALQGNMDSFRAEMIQVAAVALAIIESHDLYRVD